jgi:hypothetical protein
MAVWNILWLFGTFFPVLVPRKIWQPWILNPLASLSTLLHCVEDWRKKDFPKLNTWYFSTNAQAYQERDVPLYIFLAQLSRTQRALTK